MNGNEKPKVFKIMKIIGCIGVLLAVIGIVLIIIGSNRMFNSTDTFGSSGVFYGSGTDDFESLVKSQSNGFNESKSSSFKGFNISALGMVLTFFGGSMTTIGFIVGFSPDLRKLSIKATKYVQSENKDDLKDIADTSAEIHSDAITNVARSIKEGLRNTVYCKHCGKEIDADSTFCRYCGKSQE